MVAKRKMLAPLKSKTITSLTVTDFQKDSQDFSTGYFAVFERQLDIKHTLHSGSISQDALKRDSDFQSNIFLSK